MQKKRQLCLHVVVKKVMKNDLTFEEMADSLILTVCEERLKILRNAEERIDRALLFDDEFCNAYDFVRKIIVEDRNKIYGFNRLLYKADYISADEYFRLQNETHDKFEKLEMKFVLRYVKDYFSKDDE